MKTRQFTQLLAAGVMAVTLGFGTAKAQDCEAYFPMKNGASFELTHYNEKGKLENSTATTIVDESGNASAAIVKVHAVTRDAKGKDLASTDYTVACNNGEFHMDMRAMSMGQQQQSMQGVEGVTMEIDATDMVFPTGLAVGSTLPDASMTMKATMNGMTIMNNTTKVTNRKVTAKESKTTPAGTFDCVVIEEDTEMHGAMGMNMTSHSKAWYSLGVGMVRQEYYRNGKLGGYSELTKISGN